METRTLKKGTAESFWLVVACGMVIGILLIVGAAISMTDAEVIWWKQFLASAVR